MNSIFNTKILFERKSRINYNDILDREISERVIEDLQDFIFFHKINFQYISKILEIKNDIIYTKSDLDAIDKNSINISHDDKNNIFEIQKYSEIDIAILINFLNRVNNLNEYLLNIKKILKNDATLCGNFFGTNTLFNIKNQLIEIESKFGNKIYPRFLPYIDIKTLGSILQSHGFKNISILSEDIKYKFPNIKDAMIFLKNINQRNCLNAMQKDFSCKKIFIEFLSSFNGEVVLNFEVLTFFCTK
jgi:hypothetical protein